jgi:hypothetical protein
VEKERDELRAYMNAQIETLTVARDLAREDATRYREALEKIAAGRLNPDLGQIVGSEHYEGAWLDGVEMVREALGQGSGGE